MKLFQAINKFFQKQPYGHNTIIMLIGNEHTMLTAYGIKGFTRMVNIPNNDQEYLGKYRSFLNQFKSWRVVILIDNEKIEIKTESLPVLQSMIKTRDHAKHFVFSSVGEDKIVAYCKSDKTTAVAEGVENISFAYTQISVQLRDIINFIYNFDFVLEGIYLLPLEIQEVIRNITSDLHLTFDDKFTIFVVPTLVSGIRVFALSKGMIFASHIVSYPIKKSQEYIAGLIEQSVSEMLIKHKKYISSQKLIAEIISLSSSECMKALQSNELVVKWHALSWSGVKKKMSVGDFGDEILIHNLQLKYSATNKPLRKVYRIEKTNKYMSYIFLGIIICILSYLGFMECRIFSTENRLDQLNNEYYKLSEAYREARKKLQHTNDTPAIYDIISDLALLHVPTQQPLEISKYVVQVKKEKDDIIEILWNLTVENIGSMESELVIYTQYPGVIVSEEEVQKRVNMYKSGLSALLPQYQVILIEAKKQKGVTLPNNVTVRTNFLIKGPIENNE